MNSDFAYGWLVVLWIFQGLGFIRVYFQSKHEESMAARNVAFVLHLITLVALMNIKV
jgi:hypothetical protein